MCLKKFELRVFGDIAASASSVIRHWFCALGAMRSAASHCSSWLPGKENGPTRRPSFFSLVEVARIELASGSAPQSGLHA